MTVDATLRERVAAATRDWVDLDPCPGHAWHHPSPLRLVSHHIQPLSWNGPNIAANRISVCDTCHYAAHVVLEVFRVAGAVVPRTAVRAALGLPKGWPLSRFAYDLAEEGWGRAHAAKVPVARRASLAQIMAA